jgi:Uncharacterized protein conserved in bacteria (DUF2313).
MLHRRLIDYLPPVIKNVREYIAVFDTAEQPEFELMWDNVDTAFLNQFIMESTLYGIQRWERILNIIPRAADTLETRKFRILTMLNASLPYTIRMLEEMLTNLCGKDGFSLELLNEIYTLIVKVDLIAEQNFNAVVDLLHRVVPANIVINVFLKYNSHLVLSEFTHEELARYTHSELRTEDLEHLPYNYNSHDHLSEFTHTQLSEFTHLQIRMEEI